MVYLVFVTLVVAVVVVSRCVIISVTMTNRMQSAQDANGTTCYTQRITSSYGLPTYL